MKTLTQTLLIVGSLSLAGMMTSCQTATADITSAVTCDKCKTVWVKRATQVGPAGKSNAYVLKSEKSMECPDCESAVAAFFKAEPLAVS